MKPVWIIKKLGVSGARKPWRPEQQEWTLEDSNL